MYLYLRFGTQVQARYNAGKNVIKIQLKRPLMRILLACNTETSTTRPRTRSCTFIPKAHGYFRIWPKSHFLDNASLVVCACFARDIFWCKTVYLRKIFGKNHVPGSKIAHLHVLVLVPEVTFLGWICTCTLYLTQRLLMYFVPEPEFRFRYNLPKRMVGNYPKLIECIVVY